MSIWKWIFKAALAVSNDPAVRSWVARKAGEVVAKIRMKADAKATSITDVALPKAE